MSERLNKAIEAIDKIDPELLKLRQLAHEKQQDIAGLTPYQSETLARFDNFINGEPLTTDFDRQQSKVFLLTEPSDNK